MLLYLTTDIYTQRDMAYVLVKQMFISSTSTWVSSVITLGSNAT